MHRKGMQLGLELKMNAGGGWKKQKIIKVSKVINICKINAKMSTPELRSHLQLKWIV